jgi:mono/diheme cytochrome c family protein
MPRVPARRALLPALAVGLGLLASGCGSDEIDVAENDPLRQGAVLFNERCSGCHTLDAAAARGSAPERQVGGGERTNGPNLNSRSERPEDVMYAIRNGGFSGAIMPANIVTGRDAEVVAKFVAQYSGKQKTELNREAVKKRSNE